MSEEFQRHLLVETIRGTVQREIYNATKAAKKPKEFLNWVDSFYESHIELMSKRLPGFEDMVKTHIEESKRQLLEASGQATPDNLQEVIKYLVSNWSERILPIAHAVMERKNE